MKKDKKKHILFLTGSRADYGKMKPLMEVVEKHPDLDCSIAVTGMHLLPQYGLTVTQIYRDGFKDIHTFTNQEPGKPSGRDHVVANTIKGLNSILNSVKPDMLIIHGDRPETLAGAICGSLNLVLTAHIEGGELSGTIDELIRHAVSKLVHLHFVSTRESMKRLVQMGEIEQSIHVIGSPNIDIMLNGKLPEMQKVRDHYNISFEKYIILLYHPVAYELDGLESGINQILDGIKESGRLCLAIFPNNEPGSEIIIKNYKKRTHEKWMRLLPSMRFEYFLTLLKYSQGIVGNSSCGIHEAPVYGIPTINLGTRQKNRFHHKSIIDIPESGDTLKTELTRLESFKGKKILHFGDGNSFQRFKNLITGEKIWMTSIEKQFRDEVT